MVWLFLTRLSLIALYANVEGSKGLSHLSRQDLFQNSIMSTAGSVFPRRTSANVQVSHLSKPLKVSSSNLCRTVGFVDKRHITVYCISAIFRCARHCSSCQRTNQLVNEKRGACLMAFIAWKGPQAASQQIEIGGGDSESRKCDETG